MRCRGSSSNGGAGRRSGGIGRDRGRSRGGESNLHTVEVGRNQLSNSSIETPSPDPAAPDDGTEVHLVLSVRDLVRQIPAEWQENVKHRSTITYEEFLAQLRDPRAEEAHQLRLAEDHQHVMSCAHPHNPR